MWRTNGLRRSRLGISVGRRFGTAVERNRFKRMVREAFRGTLELRAAGIDVVVVGRDAAVLARRDEVAEALRGVLERATARRRGTAG